MKVKYDVKLNDKIYFYKEQMISISKDKIFKISDGGTDDITKVTIEKITKIN
ncbi:hypothetical protein MSHRCOH1_03900 [Candidatus Ornithobacterium hominis]|nr:hypothetical protein MSHRCOH1_03900 [Candidatus Ornithobacterium hominis]